MINAQPLLLSSFSFLFPCFLLFFFRFWYKISQGPLRRGHPNLLCIVPSLVYVLPRQAQSCRGISNMLNAHFLRTAIVEFICQVRMHTLEALNVQICYPATAMCGFQFFFQKCGPSCTNRGKLFYVLIDPQSVT